MEHIWIMVHGGTWPVYGWESALFGPLPRAALPASRLGLIITKTTTKKEAALIGGHRYRLHAIGQPATGVPVNLLCLADRIKALEVKASQGKPVRPTARNSGFVAR